MTNLPVRHQDNSQDRNPAAFPPQNLWVFSVSISPRQQTKAHLFSGQISFHFWLLTPWNSLSHLLLHLLLCFSGLKFLLKKTGQEVGAGGRESLDSPSTGRTGKIKFQTPSGSVTVDQHGKNTVVLLDRAD